VCDYVESMRKHWLTLGLTLIVCAGCRTIPSGQYGITRIDWIGQEEMSDDALEACLVTREREATVLRLGLGAGKCGEPPFDSTPPKITLWTLPWTEWPVYDPAIFDVDKERILRWYRARGFYDARILGVRTYVDGEMVADPVECDPNQSSCKLVLMVQLEEGNFVHVEDVRLETKVPIAPAVRRTIEKALTVKRNKRFDEHDYESDKEIILNELQDASFARAKVSGRVAIDTDARTARVVYELDPGPACTFGTVRVEGAGNGIPEELIIQAAAIREGKPFSQENLRDAQSAIFALGPFASVQVIPEGEGSRVDLLAKVRVGQIERWSGGVGMMSGTLQNTVEQESVPEWDIHLSGAYENRNVFGGLRHLRIEERPRLIFLDEFPSAPKPNFGNLISLKFEQPGTFEPRTTLFVETSWDFGPDPYQAFFRHDLSTRVGLARPFWRQKIQLRAAIGHDIYDITDAHPPANVSSYRLPYLEQQVVFDFRDNRQRPTLGAYASTVVQEAFRLGDYGSWNYIRITPDFRGYVPLMWDFVLAARFALGALFISDRSRDLDEESSLLGPNAYRLRGGGANSDRGFRAGSLGVGEGGGIRRYEASLELRVPLGKDLGVVVFSDIGDVSRGKEIRFDHTNAAVGFGLRYFTILGAIRFDAGWLVPGLQRIGDSNDPANDVHVGFLPSQAFLTIGEAF
jgi:outer membrane protein assembly factor BamA